MKESIWSRRKVIIFVAILTSILLAILAMAAVENLYATSQSCTPTNQCTVTTGTNTLGPEDGATGSAAGTWAGSGIIWEFTMNDSQRLGTFTSANITIYNLDFTWTASGQSDTIDLQYCIGASCTTIATLTSVNATDPVQNVTFTASNIQSFNDANSTSVRFIGVTKNQGPDTMTVILDAVSIDVEYDPPTLGSIIQLSNNTIFALETINVTGTCNCTGNYQCENVFMTLQDNRTGVFSDSTTSTTADIYTNITTYPIGTISAGSEVNKTFSLTGNNPGNYSTRIVCNSTNALGSPANSNTKTLLVNQNAYITTIASPNSTNPIQINAGENITIHFNFTKNGNPITSNVQADNITVGGLACTENPGITYRSGIGFWEVNCSTDFTLTTGLKDLYLVANYTTDSSTANDTNLQSVNVTAQTPPNVTSIVVDDTAPLGEVNLLAGSQTQVYCNASVFDLNGAENIREANATFFFSGNQATDPDNNNTHYTNSSCTATGSSGNYKNFTCGFSVQYYAVNGTWNCNVTVTDNRSFTDTRINSTTISPLFALNTSLSLIDYDNAAINQTSSEILVNITNLGNQPINISLWGYGGSDSSAGSGLSMVCPQNNITIEHERFSQTSSPYSSKTSLNSTPQPIGYTIPKQTDSTTRQNTSYWQMYVPILDPPVGRGICNGTVIFQAESS